MFAIFSNYGITVIDNLDGEEILIQDHGSNYLVYKNKTPGMQEHTFTSPWLRKYTKVYFRPNIYVDDLLYALGAWD